MNDLTKRPTEAQQAEPAAWLVLDKDGSLVHAAAHREFAHEHINDAINEHGITEAARWVVRPAFTAPIAATPAPAPLTTASSFDCATEQERAAFFKWFDYAFDPEADEMALNAFAAGLRAGQGKETSK